MKQVFDLKALQETLIQELPFSILALESVKHQIKFNFQPPKEFYVCENEELSLVVIKELGDESFPVFTILCREGDASKAEHELKEIIPWDQPWGIGGLPDYLVGALKAKAQNQGPKEFLEESECWVAILDPDTTIPGIDIPPNCKVQHVALNDVEFMDQLWKFQSSTSLPLLKAQAERGLAFGTYVDGELKSSLVTFNFGPLGALATAETHRKKGLAQMALIYAAKHLRSEGLTPFAFIETFNKPSFGLFMKTGFTHTHNVSWLFWKRPQ
ncbi:hypothetical protein TCAL_13244 [Tigriopus californicus]|uniref:N-acetyltransferase domain-containing protein n=1 Tax=Tigriopus californicus TaxID=6832 RepID=A0A553PSG1_TIGCA|nr:uncharacterized protein LOC131891654 [Tigriopus californicus]TRY80619.1 hypothetical protein TCAL_13244 [Tigriopus californicus]|eukprot:TCALIF_13244-PA protein Name:"Protein of unknown function" AED:0.00 eAED:0.00 QI:127/1/1/1/0.5/0.66/3/330/269